MKQKAKEYKEKAKEKAKELKDKAKEKAKQAQMWACRRWYCCREGQRSRRRAAIVAVVFVVKKVKAQVVTRCNCRRWIL